MQEIRINVSENEKEVLLIENYKIVERYSIKDNGCINGNIYIGTIKNIIPGIKAAFVDIGKDKNAFIHFEDMEKTNKKIVLNEKILVQVQKSPIDKKGAKLTTNIKLTGRYIVLMPKIKFVTASRKIVDEKRKKELIKLAEDSLDGKYGAILRTSSSLATNEEILKDLNSLIKRWEALDKKLKEEKIIKPILVEENSNIITSIILGTVDFGMNKIITNNKEENKKIEEFLTVLQLGQNVKVEYEKDVFNKYNIYKELENLKSNKVWLKCGGYLIIDKTEALTAIDVNSGKCIGKNDLKETIFKVNKESTIEIARQLRLRDIGGIIIIDYIDMEETDCNKELLKLFEQEVKKDRSKVQIEEFTKLNLLELTRRQIYSNND